jgi:hypothetical protein
MLGYLYPHDWFSDLATIASVTCSLLTIAHFKPSTHE